MDEIFDYWITRRGIKRGEVPNKKVLVYASYKRWVEAEWDGEIKPLKMSSFFKLMERRGYKQVRLVSSGTSTDCLLLNKAIVPVSSIMKHNRAKQQLFKKKPKPLFKWQEVKPRRQSPE